MVFLGSLPQNTGRDESCPPQIQSSDPANDVRLSALQSHCLGKTTQPNPLPQPRTSPHLAGLALMRGESETDPRETGDLVPALRESEIALRTQLTPAPGNKFCIFMRLPRISCKHQCMLSTARDSVCLGAGRDLANYLVQEGP